jgi:hypothetical protein
VVILPLNSHSGARAKLANPESITRSVISSAQGLWIPALAALGRNDAERL